MELIVIMITGLFICLSMLLSPASATAMQIQELPPLHEQARAEMHLSLPTLPRKLRFLEEKQAIISAQETSTSNKEKKDASSAGKASKREERMAVHGSKGTWQEWVEGSDTSHFFTMDYSQVKRRRPIHNKSLPVGP